MIIQGHALTELKKMDSDSIDSVITSPPYWSLRKYDIPDVIFDGTEGCEHEWGDKKIVKVGHFEGWADSMTDGHSRGCPSKKRNSEASQGQFCLHCGAWRGQLGLEPTFDLYLKHLLEIFDEVKRVLKKEGTCWVNLGDSYGTHNSGGKGYSHNFRQDDIGQSLKKQKQIVPEKSLILIPYRFAIAMTERRNYIIENETDRAWLAGIIEGEGCIHIHKRENGRKHATYGIFLSVHNTNERLIKKVAEITRQANNIQKTQKAENHPLHHWYSVSLNAEKILREVYPYFVTKRDQVRCALYCPSSGDEAEECWQNIKKMHHYNQPTRDYPEPKTQGGDDPWILRNVIIWRKPNCMPSSAKDRFTVDFEPVFFFTKNRKYWFEQQYDSSITPIDSKAGQTFGSKNGKRNTQYLAQTNIVGKKWEYSSSRNKRCVWDCPTQPYPESHFATFPEDLVEPMIKAGCPVNGTVLDPFCGSGTVLKVAERLQRQAIGIDLGYEELATERTKWNQIELMP